MSPSTFAAIVVLFVLGLASGLTGFWFGYNARGVEDLGAQAHYVLPEVEQFPNGTGLTRVSF
jgi:hypothetical protein